MPILKLFNFRKIRSAEIALGKITIFAATNGRGKTTLLQALQAVTTSTPMPVPGFDSRKTSKLISYGADKAAVALEEPEGADPWYVRLTWPDGKTKTKGNPWQLNRYAAMLDSLATDPPATRAERLCAYLDAFPTAEDLKNRLEILGLTDPTVIPKIIETVEISEYDGAHQVAVKKGQTLKGQWKQIAGREYGSKIADGWTPAAWYADLHDQTVDSLTVTLNQADSARIEAEKNAAISKEYYEQLIEEAKSLPKLRESLADIQNQLIGAEAQLEKLKQVRGKLPYADSPGVQACPHCNGKLSVNPQGQIIAAPGALTPEATAKRKEAIREADKGIREAECVVSTMLNDQAALRGKILSAEKAELSARELEPKLANHGDKAAIEEAKKAYEVARQRLEARKQYDAAAEINRQIVDNQKIIDLLAPDGIRLDKLGFALEAFNQTLSSICTTAGWGQVRVNADMSIEYHDGEEWQIYELHSKSIQLRTRISLAYAMAAYSKQKMIIVDEVDMLDQQGRNGLFRLATSSEQWLIVGMTAASPDKIPAGKLTGHGGKCYWIAGNNVTGIE